MLNMLGNYLKSNAGNLHIFLNGVITALVFFLLLLLGLFILRLLFRNASKIRGLDLPTEHGSVYISTNAIFDLIRSMDRDFPCFRIYKIRLVENKEGKLVLRIRANYIKSENPLLTAADDFQSSALALLKNSFGIDNIASVILIIPRGRV